MITYAYNVRGLTYGGLGEHQRAIEDFDKAIQMYPDYAALYGNRGRAYQALAQASSWMTRRKWSSKAQEDFEKVRSLGRR